MSVCINLSIVKSNDHVAEVCFFNQGRPGGKWYTSIPEKRVPSIPKILPQNHAIPKFGKRQYTFLPQKAQF